MMEVSSEKLKSSNIASENCSLSCKLLQILRKSTIIPTIVAQWIGYFPFTLTSNPLSPNQLRFSPRGIYFLVLIFHSIIGTLCPLFCMYNMDVHERLASDWSSTEKFAYGMIFNIISISKGFIRSMSYIQRKEILKFHSKFNSTMIHIFSTFIRRRGGDPGQTSTSPSLEELEHHLRQRAEKPLRFVWALLITLEFLFIPMMVFLLLRFTNEGILEKSGLSVGKVLICILAMAICMLTGVLYSAFLYWLVAIIHCMEVGFLLLGEGVGASSPICTQDEQPSISTPMVMLTPSISNIAITLAADRGQNLELETPFQENNAPPTAVDESQDLIINLHENPADSSTSVMNLSTFASNFSLLESLVKEFNMVFKYHIGIILLGCCASWILHTFVLINSWMKEGVHAFGTLVLVLWTILDTAGIVSVCNASSQLAHQAQLATELMRDKAVEQLDTNLMDAIRVQIHLTSSLANPVFIVPGNYFVLKRSTIISIYAVMITYVFVVLQFQDAERKNKL